MALFNIQLNGNDYYLLRFRKVPSYLRSTIFWYSIRISLPRALAWIIVKIFASLSSLISSRWPKRPALKNTWYIHRCHFTIAKDWVLELHWPHWNPSEEWCFYWHNIKSKSIKGQMLLTPGTALYRPKDTLKPGLISPALKRPKYFIATILLPRYFSTVARFRAGQLNHNSQLQRSLLIGSCHNCAWSHFKICSSFCGPSLFDCT